MTTVQRLRVRSAIALRHATSRRTAWPELDSTRSKVIVALAADYGNLGDLAITLAQVKYLERNLPDRQVVVWPVSQVVKRAKGLRREVGPHDTITLIGGGNTGDQYDDFEALRQLVIRDFPRNRIVSFPQSVSFSPTAYGRVARAHSGRVYASHGDLHLIARDSASLSEYRRLGRALSASLAPDIVLSLDESQPRVDRRGIVFSLRQDAESLLTSEERKHILRQASRLDQVTHADTHVGAGRFTPERRTEALQAIWRTYRHSSLVVTDRLHGMIFSVITGTPCIAFDSHGSKVARFHADWLADIDGVRMLQIEEVADIAQVAGDVQGRIGLHPRARDLREQIDAGILPFLPATTPAR